eukprot:NODE_1940_length_1030_cov_269.565128.p1 GENE.NODE_1940_length_1030_cov_269.565128~~NODE_1940_length_1030_cov_269.565128.p1  ORF type:complete len:328 (-),score=75.19 NODE_1940_length_1030_cov_269.565128:47-886(-)
MCLFISIFPLLLLCTLAMPESPRWLACMNDPRGLDNSLHKLRANDVTAESVELLRIAGPATPLQGSLRTRLAGCRRSLVIIFGLMLFQQCSGVNAIIAYSTKICSDVGLEDPAVSSMSLMGTQLVFALVSCLTVERAGRRKLMIFGGSLMMAGHFLIAYQFYAMRHELWGPALLSLVGLWAFMIGFAVGMIQWVIVGEIFPDESRSIGSSLGAAVVWTASFLVTLAFPYLEEAVSKEGTFVLFGCICAAGVAFVFVVLPETKGKPIEEVLEILKRGRRV